MISRCKSPKKPHLKPKPRALDVSGSNESEASFRDVYKRQEGIASNKQSIGYRSTGRVNNYRLRKLNFLVIILVGICFSFITRKLSFRSR